MRDTCLARCRPRHLNIREVLQQTEMSRPCNQTHLHHHRLPHLSQQETSLDYKPILWVWDMPILPRPDDSILVVDEKISSHICPGWYEKERLHDQ